MVLPEDSERKLYKQFYELCRSLNLDKSTSSEAWKNFSETYEPYTHAGEAFHWMGCALYVACKTATIPTVSKTSVVVQGNLVNLKGLLKLVDLSIIEFFLKIRRWANFASLSDEFLASLDQLERDFTVSMVLFKKFQPIFADLFSDNIGDNPKSQKNKKQRANLVPMMRIFDFSWTLFICVKSNYPKISDDLVNSYHLLLACFDFIFVNIYMSGRKDIINNNFPIPQSIKGKCNSLSDVSCILDVLCSRHDGISVEAKSIKEYCWRKHIKQMFEKRVLKGNVQLFSEIIDTAYFEQNFKAVNKLYEEYVLSVGTFDERIFLGRTNNSYSSEMYSSKLGELTEKLEGKRKSLNKNSAPMTPLTGRQYLKPVLHERSSAFSTNRNELQNFASLQSIVGLREAAPSELLLKIMSSCETKPTLEEIVQKLAVQIKEKYLEDEEMNKEDAEKQCETVVKLFYKLMDSIVPEETKKPAFDPKSLLNQEIFIKTLFACAFEITAFLCTSPQQYPWISDTLDLPHYYFYKIIEVVVRTEDSLSRDVVKHLNTIEEKILDSLAWKRDSPLWKAIIDSGQGVPCCEDVSNRITGVECTPTKQLPDDDKLSVLAGKESSLTNSPGAPLADKFTSPQRINFSSKRPNENDPDSAVKLLKIDTGGDGTKANSSFMKVTSVSEQIPDMYSGKDIVAFKENKKPRRTGPVALFFRKFYYLSAVRMLDLCKQLKLTDSEVRKKIWTCFEETVVRHVGLLLDRHLDQLLMCSIYVICKIVGIELQFTDVMKCYRNQPQASSDVYREVLISPDLTLEDLKDPKNLEVSERKEKRKDIIKFYNQVYISKVKSLVRKFNSTLENNRIVLSPIPIGLQTPPNTSRRISEKHSLYLRSFEQEKCGENSPNGNSQLSYKFSRSPAKDLRAINNMVSKADITRLGKRLLADDISEKNNSYSMALSKKVKGLYNDRITAGAQD